MRYTAGMSGRPSRLALRRLILLLLLSLLLHLLGLELYLRTHTAGGQSGASGALAVRLRPAPAAMAARADVAGTPAKPVLPATPARPPAAPYGASLGVPLAAGPRPPAAGSAASGHANTTLPDPFTLEYATDLQGTGASGSARLRWRSDGMHYDAELTEDLPGGQSALRSRGTIGDDGIEPGQTEETTARARHDLLFDAAARRLTLPGGHSEDLAPGTQDGLSALIQLSAIVAAAPEAPASVDLLVAGAGGAQPTRFVLAGNEDLDLPAGRWRSLHYVQLAAPGAPRLELWLAPVRGWLPVQLRWTQGTRVLTRRLVRIGP